MVKKKASVKLAAIMREQPRQFWESIQIYPSVVKQGVRDFRGNALSQLKKSGANALRMIVERAKLAQPKDASQEQLAALLLSKDRHSTLIYLAEFVRNRGQAVLDEYDSHFSDKVKKGYIAQLDQLSHGPMGSLKQFVKLLLLYEDDELTLERIFVRALWRRRKSTREFVAETKLTNAFTGDVESKRDELAATLSNAYSGRELRFFTRVQLGSWDIILFQNEYSPVVRPDYRDVQKTVRGYGWIMLGFERDKNRIILKGGGEKVAKLVEEWFEHELSTELTDAERSVFTDYDAQLVEDAFLGGNPASTKFFVTGLSFRRSQLPQHSAITIQAAHSGQDMRLDLEDLRQKEILRLRSLSDLAWCRVDFNGKEVRVEVQVSKRGAITLALDDTDLTEAEIDELRKEFLAQFHVPLNRQIDPQMLILGSVDVYNFLLETEEIDNIVPYQRDALNHLLDLNLMDTEPIERMICPNIVTCKVGGKPVIDEDVVECPDCQAELKVKETTRLVRNDAEIRAFMNPILSATTGWDFSGEARKFEKKEFFPLINPTRPDQVVRVYFEPRVGKKLLESLDRSHQPVLVVHTGGEVGHAHLDGTGVAHASLARAIAAQSDPQEQERFAEDLDRALRSLVSRQEEKVLRRAWISRQRIADPPATYKGEDYEADIFNVIRSIFPYTEYWTGKNRPDGFCSLVYFDSGNLRKPIKCNWSYDAKFTKKAGGYDLSIDEERKIWDYVAALMKTDELAAQGNDLDAHVIISNRVTEGQMKKVAEFVRMEHRLGKDHQNLKIVFTLDPFWMTLYDRVRDNEIEFKKRGPALSKRFAELLRSEKDGFVQLDAKAASDLADYVLKKTPIENPVDAKLLTEELSEKMTQ